MNCRWLKASLVGLLAMSAWLTVSPQPAQAQIIAIGAGVWGWRNIVAPQVGGPWIAPDVRFRPFGLLDDDRWFYDEMPAPSSSAQVIIMVPDANAEVFVQGRRLPMMGKQRAFMSPVLEDGFNYSYEIRARWGEGKEAVDQTRTVRIRAGDQVMVDFTRPAGK